MKHRTYRSKNTLGIMIASGIVIGGLVFATIIYFVRDIRISQDKIIIEHLQTLTKIFNKIHATAKITDFDHVINQIDFLNVKSFTGSEVGSMNLAYPEKWQGPYLEANLTIQEKPYIVVKTKKGLLIIPGEGVRLSNGKIIGKDIIINENTDIQALARDPHALLFKNKGLAVKLNLDKPSDKITAIAEPLSLIDEVD